VTPIKHNLVAIGSAAVLAVYSAGYARTKAAADRFAVEDAARRQEHERRARPVVAAPTPPVTPPVSVAETPVVYEAPSHVEKHARKASAPQPELTRVDSAPASTPAPAPATVSAPAPVPAPKPAEPVPAPTVVSPAAPAADTVKDEDKPLKDGVYSGYGRSRHGDIEATVSIKNGKIVEAFISECLTQYSCSWIAALPPQVVARQSAEVDYISGATQSTNAFYYAVIAALKKAR
jgi:uncharacterized protein with FMN-binding domain